MMDRQPPTDNELLEYVRQVLENSNLEKMTTKEVCNQVYGHYSDFDLEHKKEFIRTSVNRIMNTGPTTPQAENLVNNDLETCQKWEAVANDLNMLEEAASRAPLSWAGTSPHNRTQQPRLEEDENEETPTEPPRTPEKQVASQPTDASGYDVDAESTGDVSQTEEVGCASIYCKNRKPAAVVPLAMRFIGGKIPKRRLRQRIRTTPTKLGPLTVLQRMIRLEERHLSLTRDNAIALNHVADSVDRLADFITECSHRIAGDIERRNTPN